MMRTKVKLLKSEKVKEEPGTEVKTKLKNEISVGAKKEYAANGEEKPLIT